MAKMAKQAINPKSNIIYLVFLERSGVKDLNVIGLIIRFSMWMWNSDRFRFEIANQRVSTSIRFIRRCTSTSNLRSNSHVPIGNCFSTVYLRMSFGVRLTNLHEYIYIYIYINLQAVYINNATN